MNSSLLLIVIYGILLELYPNRSSLYYICYTLSIALFPTIYFFTFLYYTDSLSLLLVMTSYLFALYSHGGEKGRYVCLSAFFALLSIFMRQTNIVWSCFIGGTILFQRYNHYWHSCCSFGTQLQTFVKQLLTNLCSTLSILSPYLVYCILFLWFVHYNHGIVLGDQSNHQFSLHLSQIPYYVVVATPLVLDAVYPQFYQQQSSTPSKSSLRRLLCSVLCLCVFYCICFKFMIIHPFLLSDNRHYTFYFYSKILKNHKHLLLLPLAISTIILLKQLSTSISSLYMVFYFLCLSTLALSPLIEFRYFTIPLAFMMLFMNYRYSPFLSLLLSLLLNVVTLYLFLYKPYVWNDGSIAHFMW